jgi:predicted membrane-bound dolichyl-phosphate-mannose-protein mannosyltransferase
MEDIKDSLDSLLDSAEQYGKTSLELLKLKAADKAADVMSSVISRAIAVFILFMFFLIATIGLAVWLGEITGKYSYGFFIVAAFYGITGIILFFFMHKRIKTYFNNSLIKQFFK